MIFIPKTTMQQSLLYFIPPNKPFKNEAEFTTWFWRQIKEHWWFRHKISDMSIELKPFDWILAIDWYVAAVEIKVSDHKHKVDVYKMLRDNQKTWLAKYKKNWWNSLVIYYNKVINQYFIREYNPDDLVIKF